MAPPLRAWPLPSRSQSARQGAPQRLPARTTTAACWEQVGRHMAGTVRLLCREMPPAWRTWLP